ncbi:hypothetical protein I2W78_29360 [Streptomyces spinoverrucosus]|uniref:hypothetical protein n=1 Tax=Streptomyces spinoverrucosus TaxID=284043 RepID=UPI0018C3A3E7|nr:hypothetical protein [Streptomyces spinoverrucosus]MBG0855840.1 hypothetical protein [Streptomyces spinoverrucosus]
MRIRSALAATVLAAALTVTGTATATALDNHRDGSDDSVPCSPYEGEIDTETADLEWSGAVCHKGVFDF